VINGRLFGKTFWNQNMRQLALYCHRTSHKWGRLGWRVLFISTPNICILIYEKFMRLNELTDTVLGSLQFFVFIFVWSIEINGNGPTYWKKGNGAVFIRPGIQCSCLIKDQSKLIWDANKTKVVGIEITLS
jgi:hypothetical protein